MSADRPHILIAESAGFSRAAIEKLQAVAEVALDDLNRPALLRKLGGVEVLWVRLRHRIDAGILEAGRSLRAIVTPTTGLNHVDLEECANRGVTVLSLRGESEFLKDVRGTAEHTVGLILTLLRHLPEAVAEAREGAWNRDRFRGREICGKTVGIVGFGRLGRLVARYLQAFDARILLCDPELSDSNIPPGTRAASLAGLLAESDIVTLHVNLKPETRGMMGRDQFRQMKPGAWFINTARGELIDEGALREALSGGRLAGAALDVLADENPGGMPDHPLVQHAREHSNLILTPHIGGATAESMEKTEVFMAEKLSAWLRVNRHEPVSSVHLV